MTATIDKKKYLDPIDAADISLKVIETEDEYDRFLVVAEKVKYIESLPDETIDEVISKLRVLLG